MWYFGYFSEHEDFLGLPSDDTDECSEDIVGFRAVESTSSTDRLVYCVHFAEVKERLSFLSRCSLLAMTVPDIENATCCSDTCDIFRDNEMRDIGMVVSRNEPSDLVSSSADETFDSAVECDGSDTVIAMK